MKSLWVGSFALALAALAACEGDIGDPAPPTDPAHCTSPRPGAAPLRRLTKSEYRFSLEDLFGPAASAADGLPDEQFGADGFDNYAQNASINQLRADKMFAAAETVAKATSAELALLLPCDPSAVDDACVDAFLRSTGRRSYRHPLDDEEVAILRAVYDAGTTLPLGERVATVLHAMLMAPQFVFRAEVGDGAAGAAAPGVVALGGYEIATRLAYLLWASTPDDAVLDAAADGELATREGIARAARRMLDDPRARRGVVHFLAQWLDVAATRNDVTRDAEMYPEFDAALLDLMREQTQRFLAKVVLDEGGSVGDLLQSRAAPVEARLAALYAVAEPPGGEWATVTLPEGERSGVLTLAAWLTEKGFSRLPASVRRGKFVRTRLLCQDLGPPDPSADLTPPQLEPGMTNREILAERTKNAPCAGCHALMNDLGFAFESFDAIGRYRTTEVNGEPIDASGTLVGSDADGSFAGAAELMDRLGKSRQIHDCMAHQVFRYAEGRRPESEDACTMGTLTGAENRSIADLLVDIATSDAFRFRRVEG
jgi:hypothetical protein